MRIGFVGLGIMGSAMAGNIVKKHNDKVAVYDHHQENIDRLTALGAIPCQSELEVAEQVDIFITMVPKTEHVKAVYTDILPALHEGMICIDMSTIDPQGSVEVAEMVRTKGAEFIDAPVVKSKPAAIAGTLGIYVGGPAEVFEKVKPILSYMGENIIHLGENGKGLVMKICHNALLSQIQNGVNETSTLASLNGIDINTFALAVSYGGAGNAYLNTKKDNLANEDYTTAFSVENEHKDVHICLNLAEKSGLNMSGEENAARVYDRAMEMGLAKEDISATIKVVRENKL